MVRRGILLILMLGAVLAFFIFDLKRFVDFQYLVQEKENLESFYQAQPLVTVVSFFVTYVLIAAFSIPAASIASLAAGAIFGLWLGVLLVSFASSLGATFAFLSSRYIVRDFVEQRFANKMDKVNHEFSQEGLSYLFFLRLVPAIPFFMVNILMGLTEMRTTTFYWVSQLAMLPATFVYVNAGTELATLSSVEGILHPRILLSLMLLGVFPLLLRKMASRFRVQQTSS